MQVERLINTGGPTTGVVELTIKELHTNTGPVELARKGEKCSFPADMFIRRSDKLYKLINRKDAR